MNIGIKWKEVFLAVSDDQTNSDNLLRTIYLKNVRKALIYALEMKKNFLETIFANVRIN